MANTSNCNKKRARDDVDAEGGYRSDNTPSSPKRPRTIQLARSKEQTGSAQDPISIDDAHAPGSVDSLGDKEEYIQGFRSDEAATAEYQDRTRTNSNTEQNSKQDLPAPALAVPLSQGRNAGHSHTSSGDGDDSDSELQRALLLSMGIEIQDLDGSSTSSPHGSSPHGSDNGISPSNAQMPAASSSTYLSARALGKKTPQEALRSAIDAIMNIRRTFPVDLFWDIVHQGLNTAYEEEKAHVTPMARAEEHIQWILNARRGGFDGIERLFVRFMLNKFRLQEQEQARLTCSQFDQGLNREDQGPHII